MLKRKALLCGAAVAVLALVGAVPGAAQRPKPERIVKEEREDGSLVLDESGLTKNFEVMKNALRNVDVDEIAGGEIEVHTPRLPTMGVDYESFVALDEGIVEFRVASAIKMRTETSLRFGDVAVTTGNVAADYPGLYSLWLRKVSDDDWRLIFNHEADAHGTMHESEADVGEVALSHELTEGGKETLMIAIEPGEGGGTLKLAWGEHSWSVPFTVG
jgi:hypothetical protein